VLEPGAENPLHFDLVVLLLEVVMVLATYDLSFGKPLQTVETFQKSFLEDMINTSSFETGPECMKFESFESSFLGVSLDLEDSLIDDRHIHDPTKVFGAPGVPNPLLGLSF
jgi:hypothetical protein